MQSRKAGRSRFYSTHNAKSPILRPQNMGFLSLLNVIINQEFLVFKRLKGDGLLKKKMHVWVLIICALTMAPVFTGGSQAQEPKVTVLNPLGQPPAIVRVPMAPRISDLNGKTIYIVDIGFSGTHQLLTELQDLLKKRYPDTTWIVRKKIGTYFTDDPKLWAEIKEKGQGMIMGVGH
jgi:hypothetical protein